MICAARNAASGVPRGIMGGSSRQRSEDGADDRSGDTRRESALRAAAVRSLPRRSRVGGVAEPGFRREGSVRDAAARTRGEASPPSTTRPFHGMAKETVCSVPAPRAS